MRQLIAALALVGFSGCGAGVAPELYNVVIDYFTLPNTCYQNGAPPNIVESAAPPRLMQISVWDGAANEAFLEINSGGGSIDMGWAPNVDVGGTMRGARNQNAATWTFIADTVIATTLPNINTTTSKSRFTLTFERTQAFKGTASLTSSRECAGGGCSGAQPACDVSGIAVNGARLQVNYQTKP